MEIFCPEIKNGLGFPVGVYSPIGILKVWQNGQMKCIIPEGKNVKLLDILPENQIITQNNLPEQQEGVEWLVSEDVKYLFPFRDDFLTMLNVVTDHQGNVRGCLAFA